jgi:hypothetical protein
MSWIVKFEKEVESCEGCDLFGDVMYVKGCVYDGQGAEHDDDWYSFKKLPCEIRPCPLKVEETYCAHCKHSRYYDDFLCTKGLQRKSEADVCEGYEEE